MMRARVMALHREGLTQAQIAERLGRSRSTVNGHIRRDKAGQGLVGFVAYAAVPYAHPLIHQMCALANEQRVDRKALCSRAGVDVWAMRRWMAGANPQINTLSAVFEVLGYSITAKKNAPGY